MNTLLQVFARAPVLGQVKTRLIPQLGAARALAVYRQLLERTLAQAVASGFALEVWMPEGDRNAMTSALAASGLAVEPRLQRGADLGSRMYHALRDGRERFERVILVGSDIVDLSVAHLRQAARHLEDGAELVLGPASDGGYYLVAVGTLQAALFEGVGWGTQAVWRQTLARAAALNLRPEILPSCHDLDSADDLERATDLGVISLDE